MRPTPLVIAHRGASWDAPENTLEAFELALAQGADYVELDVRAREGELVVSHEASPPASAPLFEDVLRELAGRIGLAVEVKSHTPAGTVLAALDRHGVASDSLIVVSFHPKAILETRRRRPEVRTIQHVARVPLSWAARHAWGVGFWEPRATRRRLARARSLGLATTVYTVNDPERMRELAELGVDGIFSDRPAVLRETLLAA